MDQLTVIQDRHDRVWRYDSWLRSYRCISVSALNPMSLESLIDNYGPVHKLVRGDEIKPPFQPISCGTWVEFDGDILPKLIHGTVHSYNPDKSYYEIVINIPQELVKEAP